MKKHRTRDVPRKEPDRPNLVVPRKKIRDFLDSHPGLQGASQALERFLKLALSARLKNFASLKQTFPAADKVGPFIVFNVGANKFRVISRVDFPRTTIVLWAVLTHNEYDRDRWKGRK